MRVLVDTGPGLGLKYADVDDALAIFLMLNNPEFDIEGITTIFGNTKVHKGYPLIRKYLKLANRVEIPHKKGAACKEELGKLNPASKFLIEKVKEDPNELILLVLGPFTNAATALMHHPEFINDLKQVIIMGGTLSPSTSFTRLFRCIDRRFYDKINIKALVAEFNSFKDPKATKIFLEAKTQTPRIQMGLEVCTRTVIRDEHINRIAAVNKPIPQFIANNVQFWIKLMKKVTNRGGFFPFDTCVPIYLLEPSLFKSVNLHFDIDIDKIPGKYNILKRKRKDTAPITYCTDFVNQEAKKKFLEILISNLIK